MNPKRTLKEVFSIVPILRGVALLLLAALAYCYAGGQYTARREAKTGAMELRIEENTYSLGKLVDSTAASNDNILASINTIKVDIGKIQTDLSWLIRSQPSTAHNIETTTEGATP